MMSHHWRHGLEKSFSLCQATIEDGIEGVDYVTETAKFFTYWTVLPYIIGCYTVLAAIDAIIGIVGVALQSFIMMQVYTVCVNNVSSEMTTVEALKMNILHSNLKFACSIIFYLNAYDHLDSFKSWENSINYNNPDLVDQCSSVLRRLQSACLRFCAFWQWFYCGSLRSWPALTVVAAAPPRKHSTRDSRSPRLD